VARKSAKFHIALNEDMTMLDFSPLFRTAVGFDRLASMLEEATRTDLGGYPPYNIELTDTDHYRITLAVAGFKDDELEVEVKENVLRIAGKAAEDDEKTRKFLYRGIAGRSFERRFQLADYVRVEGAHLSNGLLHVDLIREVPEAVRPRRIAIGTQATKPAIESKAAA
jgi:molecular chaperone IbpA